VKILLEASLGIGDAVTFSPMVRRLKRAYPDAKLGIMSRHGGFLASTKLAGVDEVLVARRPRDYLRIVAEFWDLLLMPGYHRSTNGISNTLAYRLLYHAFPARRRITLGDLDAPAYRDYNRVDVYLEMVRRIGLSVTAEDRTLFLPFDIDHVGKPLAAIVSDSGFVGYRVAVIHIGSKHGYTTRDWPIPRWTSLLHHLWRQHGLLPVFIGAKDDEQRTTALLHALDIPSVDRTAKLSLAETAAVIRDADLFISTNSGPMWIAAALGKPQLAICGPSKPSWDPLNAAGVILRQRIDRPRCDPPCDARSCFYGDCRCMDEIDAAAAIDAVERLLQAGDRSLPREAPSSEAGAQAGLSGAWVPAR